MLRHVRVLKKVGLISERRHAQLRYYPLDATRLAEADQWRAPYRLFWVARLQKLREVMARKHAACMTPAATEE